MDIETLGIGVGDFNVETATLGIAAYRVSHVTIACHVGLAHVRGVS